MAGFHGPTVVVESIDEYRLAERRALGDVERARELLAKAHADAWANGYGTVERRAAAALRSLDA
jgi:hypothetical protein